MEGSVLFNRNSAAGNGVVARSTQASSVFDQMREDIVACRIMPGEKMQMEALRTSYGVGLSPIREALNRLITEGLVTQEDQKGFRAAPVSLAELEDVTLARRWIGASALKASIENGDAAWEESVLLALHRWERGIRSSSPDDPRAISLHHRLHSDFHRALLGACGSEWMLGVWDTAFDFVQRYQVMSLRSGAPRGRDPIKEHRALMEATLERDLERALALHDNHLELTLILVREIAASGDAPWSNPAATDKPFAPKKKALTGE